MIINKIPTPKNINNHCVIDNFPLSASIWSSLFLSDKTIISPIIVKKNPQQNPATGEYPLFLCIKAQSIPIATNIIIYTIVILFFFFPFILHILKLPFFVMVLPLNIQLINQFLKQLGMYILFL